MKKYASYRCQRCGELIGYLGRIWQLLRVGHICKPLELRLVHYGEEADRLINEGWQIAPEEAGNVIPLHVYLERFKEPI